MDKQKQAISNDLGTLAEDARALMAATADVAGGKVSQARTRLAAALDNGKELYGQVRDKAIDGARVTDQAVRENPYQAMAITLGAGVIVGFLVANWWARHSD